MEVASTFGFVLLMMAVGRLLAWRGVLDDRAPQALNMVVLFVCLPAAILRHAPGLHFDPALLGLVAVPWVILLVGVALVFGLTRIVQLGRPETAALLVLTVLGNTSFLGFAVIPALAGEDALRYAVVYDQFGSFIQLSTFGLIVIAIHSGEHRPTAGAIARRVLGFPPFLVLVLALTVMPDSYPAPVEAMLVRLEGALLPLVALALGVQLRLTVPRERAGLLAFGLVTKLVVMPAVALGVCLAVGITGEMRAAAVFEAGMPPMITAGALLTAAGLAPELAAGLVGFGMVAAMATLPAWWAVLNAMG